MANPFDIDALNGLNFDEDSVRGVVAAVMAPNSAGGYDINFQDNTGTGLSAGKITVIDNIYTESNFTSQDGFQIYHFASFGAIQFEGDSQTYWVHGFTENGLLLSATQDMVTFAPEGQPITGSYGIMDSGFSPTTTFIFGTYGVVGFNEVGGPNAVNQQGAIFNKDSSVFIVPDVPCFAEGTLIATSQGECVVEALEAGDLVLTASGASRAIKWIGESLIRPKRHPRPQEVQPVQVRAGAFGAGLPLRDLRLSPGHAVYVDGVLVPVGLLVNGATIVQEEVDSIRYLHVELESHDVLLAEGLPCESYLDDGNRSTFANAAGHAILYGRLDPQNWDDACAPMVADGPQLAVIRQMLHAHAEELGWTRCEEADLVIEADGVTILPEAVEGNSWRFTVPAAGSVMLRSNAGVLGHVMPELADRRTLGVAVNALIMNGAAVDLDDAAFGAGFHATERHEPLAWRWTDGAASLALGGEAASIEVTLAMIAPSWKRSAAILRIAA